MSIDSRKFSDRAKETEQALSDFDKKTSEKSLKLENKRVSDTVNNILKKELKDAENENFVDAYSNTPSSNKISKTRSLSLSSSVYSTKLLEKLVQSQSDNEFTRATLTYQESSLKLLEEIKNSVIELKPTSSKEDEINPEDFERQISTLAKSIAELDIPGLIKELKRSTLKMFDSSGMISNIEMVMEVLTSTFSDKSQMKDMFKSKFKKGVLKSVFGERMADKIGKFETDPLEVIQDFINTGANSNNQFFRALFGKHASGVGLKLGKKTRDDKSDHKALNDKLTYNTLNFRIPEALDRIESALTGKEKMSYDYSTNSYYSNSQRINNLLQSGDIVDIKSVAKDISSTFKETISDMFDEGKVSKEIANQFLNYDNDSKRFRTDKQGRVTSKDDEALESLLVQMIKNEVDMRMISGSNLNAEAFLRQNNIKIDKNVGKARLVNAVNTLNRIMALNPEAFIDDVNVDLMDIKERASKVDMFKEEFSFMTPEQISIIEMFRNGDISKSEMQAMMDGLEESKRRTVKGGYRGGYESSNKPNIPSGSRLKSLRGIKLGRDLNNTISSKSVIDGGFDVYKSVNDFGKADNGSGIVSKGSKTNEYDKYVRNLNTLLSSGVLSEERFKQLQPNKDNPNGFKLDESTAKAIDRDMIKLEKATEIYNLFLNAKLVPQLLEATTGQSYDYWVSQGYPTCPQDLFKYITFDQDNQPQIDFDSLSRLNVNFTEKYINNLSSRYRVDTKGVDIDVMDPGRTVNKALNEAFRDPSLLRKIGLKSGAGAGYFLGKILQAKGVINSPIAPYMLGGVGAMIMNMQSVQDRINMILGPEGDLKGKSGFTNREIAMAKFFNKTLPRVGLGGAVAKGVYKMFSGGGLMGTGIGLVGGGLLGLLTAAVAPGLMRIGREKLFGDDGEGNKGFWKGVGSLLKNVPWIDKYLATNISKGDSDIQLAAGTISDMEDDVSVRISELQDLQAKSNGVLTPEDQAELSALLKLKHHMGKTKSEMFKEGGVPPRKQNETDDEYAEKVKRSVMSKILNPVKVNRKKNDSFNDYMNKFESKFENKFKSRFEKRQILREHDGDIADFDYDREIKDRNIERELSNEFPGFKNSERDRLRKIFEESKESDGKDDYQRLADALLNEIDASGDKKESAMEFKKYLRSLQVQDADEALSAILDEESKKKLLEGDLNTLLELLRSNEDLREVFSTLNEFKTVNEDFLNDKDLQLIRKVARLKARSLSNDPDKDKTTVDLREEEIFQTILGEMNKKGITDRFDEKTFNVINSIRKLYSNLTGDVGYMDSEERSENKELFKKINTLDIFNNPEFQKIMEEYNQDNKEEEELEESGSGSMTKTVKMKNLQKYTFQNGKPLNLFGCSIATLNNLMVYLKIGNMDIEELITYANKHLNSDGSVRDTFFTEMADRLNLKLTVNTRKATGGFDKKFVQKIKPSSKVGYIILKHNPGVNYGHFVNIKSATKEYFVIDDPELNGVQKFSVSDIMALSDAIYMFELESIKAENDIRTSLSKKLSNTKNKLSSLKDKLVDSLTPKALKAKLSEKTSALISDLKSGFESSALGEGLSKIFGGSKNKEDLVEKSLEMSNRILDILKNGLINVRIVDDDTLPLKLTDGTVSKFVGDNKERERKSSDPNKLFKFFNRMRKAPVATAEFEKEDAVQDAIINGTLSGAGNAAAHGKAKYNEKGSVIKEKGLTNIFSDTSELISDVSKKGFMSALGIGTVGKTIKDMIFKKGSKDVAKETTKKSGSLLSKIFRRKTVAKDATKAAGSKNSIKALSKLKSVLTKFFTGLMKKLPNRLAMYISGLVKTMSKFITKFVGLFTKFFKANKKIISQKLAKKTVAGTAAKIPWVNIAVGLAFFSYSFYQGYKDAPEILKAINVPLDNSDSPSVTQRLAVGFTKGVAVSLPGYLIGALNPFLGAAFDLFMENEGFMAVLSWFMKSSGESKNTAYDFDENDLEKVQEEADRVDNEDTSKNGSRLDTEESYTDSSTVSKSDMVKTNNNSLKIEKQNLIYKMTTDDYQYANMLSHGEMEKKDRARIAEIERELGEKPTSAPDTKNDITTDPKTSTPKDASQNTTKKIGPTAKKENMYTSKSYGEALAKSMTSAPQKKGNMYAPSPAVSETSPKKDVSSTYTGWLHPLKDRSAVITSTYGMRVNPQSGKYKMHEGIDIYKPAGAPVYAVADGEVISINPAYGFVKIKHADGKVSGYMHMLSYNVKKGDKVKAGDVIGKVGGRGPKGPNHYPDHLHFSFQKSPSSKYDDPFGMLNLDPNYIKLAPKSRVAENVSYLNKHPELVKRLNDKPKANFINSGGKGGMEPEDKYADMEMTTGVSDKGDSKLSSVISELNKSIKGLTNMPTNLNNKEVEAVSSAVLVQKLTEMNTLMANLIKITASQLPKMDALIEAVVSNKIDPSEVRAMNMSRMGQF